MTDSENIVTTAVASVILGTETYVPLSTPLKDICKRGYVASGDIIDVIMFHDYLSGINDETYYSDIEDFEFGNNTISDAIEYFVDAWESHVDADVAESTSYSELIASFTNLLLFDTCYYTRTSPIPWNKRKETNRFATIVKEKYNISLPMKKVHSAKSIGDLMDIVDEVMEEEQGSNGNSETPSNATLTSQKGSCDIQIESNMDYRNKNTEYIIGIDLGHGETSAAICPLLWDKPIEQLDRAKDLEMGSNKKVLPSAITILENRDAFIGDRAFRSDILKKASVNVCFKQAPKDINGPKEQLMIRFMHEVYNSILENNPSNLKEGNHCVYIATPSGWNAEQQKLYMEMAKQAGLPIAGVTKESRAAFVCAQKDATSGLGRNVNRGAVVFDMGSSTLDFTYMNLSKGDKLIDNGYNCGASFIEKTILQNVEEKTEVVREFEKKYPKLKDRLLFEARTVKERVYFDPTAKVKKFVNFEELIEDDEDFEDERFKLMFAPGELDKLLESVGYIKQIEDAMLDFKSNYIHDAPIYGVFLTGGASRMDFIKPLVEKTWNLPAECVYRDQDPSLTISRGVAEVARIDMRTGEMDNDLNKAIDKVAKGEMVFNTFALNFGKKIKKELSSSMGNTIENFMDFDEGRSLKDLKDAIAQQADETVNNMIPKAPDYIDRAIKEHTKDIRKKVEAIVNSYSAQGMKVTLPKLDCGSVEIDDINLDKVIENVASLIEVKSTNWLKWALTGAGAIFGLIGMGIGYLVGSFFGSNELSEEEQREKAMAKVLDREERRKVGEEIQKNWNDIEADINNTIDNSILRNGKLRSDVRQTVNRLLENYKKNLRDARILVD